MKKIVSTLMGVITGTIFVHAQGFIEFAGSAAGITTNTSGYYAPDVGTYTSGLTFPGVLTGKVPFAYDFALLYWTGTGSATTDITSSGWSQVVTFTGSTPLLGTNAVGAGNFQGQGGTAGIGTTLTPGTAYSVEFVGWSSNIGGSWSQVEADIADPSWNAAGFVGWEPTIGTLTPTASTTGQPNIFPVVWANGSMVLYAAPVPEPVTLALAGLGGLSVL